MASYKYFPLLLMMLLPFKGVYSQEFTMPSFVQAIDACDMDMDGSIDIVVSCAYEDSIVILFNDGYGNFEPYYYGRTTGYLLCGCIDEDSIPDIVTTTNNLNFIKNNGDRTLTDNVVVLVPDITFPINSIVDMNNDGWNDFLYQTYTSPHIGVMQNNGDLTFTDRIIYSGNSSKPCLGDLNSDELPDITVSFPDPVTETKIYINNGNFNFSTFQILDKIINDPIIMELNDSIPEDLALFETPLPNVYFFNNTGNANLLYQGNNPLISAHAVVLNDINDYNMDGRKDICYGQCYLTGCNDSIYISFSNQYWSFALGEPYYVGILNWFRIKSVDLNGDTYPDLYMTGYNSNNKIKILWNNGDGTFSYLNPVGLDDSGLERIPILSASPNPFNDNIRILFHCDDISDVLLMIFDIRGAEIRHLFDNQKKSEGIYQCNWDGKDNTGKICKPGLYIIILQLNGHLYSHKIIYY